MPVVAQNNVILVNHAGNGAAADVEALCESIRAEIKKIGATGREYAIFHDSTNLNSASEPYARAFAKLFSEIKKQEPIQVALIDKAILRVMARLAATLSGTDLRVFKTHTECVDFLFSAGFVFTPHAAPPPGAAAPAPKLTTVRSGN